MVWKHITLLTAATGLGLAAWSATSLQAHTSSSSPETCEIQLETSRTSLTLFGLVHGKAGEDGTYRLKISGGGSGGTTTISQGSSFKIDRSGKQQLGKVQLDSEGVYDAELRIDIGGRTYTCNERFGDRI